MSAATQVVGSGALGPAFDSVLTAAQAGAPWALRLLYEEVSPAVCGYARGQGADDPEGLVNETFMRAFRRIGDFAGGPAQFRSWVFTIARNLLIDERRRHSRRVIETSVEQHLEDRETVASAEETAMEAVSEAAVIALLHRLPADQRDVLLMRLVGDLTVAQIAEALGRSVGAVKALQRRGLRRLQAAVAKGGAPL